MKWLLIVLYLGKFDTYYHLAEDDCTRAGAAMELLSKNAAAANTLVVASPVRWMCIKLEGL